MQKDQLNQSGARSSSLSKRMRLPQPLFSGTSTDRPIEPSGGRPWVVWVVSFGVWTVIALAGAGTVYEFWLARGYPMTFPTVLGLQFSQTLTYAPLTPFVYFLALRFPFQRQNWPLRALQHLVFALVFSIAHSVLRGVTPFAAWDPKLVHFISGIWNSETHAFVFEWPIFRNLFLTNVVDDITGTYLPIVLVAHALTYYQKLRDRDLHSAKLEMQLAQARLQTLKNNLQPHFLFNTMHSISALMLTDVPAADRMMARLSDLLRMSLENSEIQTTCLSRELEFVAGYLEIEKIRLEERLHVTLDIAPDTLDAQVPYLILQPLVENAIRHGISRLSSGGKVWITAHHDGPSLVLRVKDNGPGWDPLNATAGAGLGLRTTRERLSTLYGNNQTFEILPDSVRGVEICVKLPFLIDPQLQKDEFAFTHSAGD